MSIDLFDDSLILALNNVSRLVPENETIVVSYRAPVSQYFTKHNTLIPWGTYSEESLFDYMKKNDYKYLLVYQGNSGVADLASLFSANGLEELNNHFSNFSAYDTEYLSIYLYIRKG